MQATTLNTPRYLAPLVKALNAAGVVWVFALMFLICADIVARTLFDDPIAGVTEMVSLSLVASVFLQLAHAVLHGRLMRVEMFIGPLERARPAAAQAWLALFGTLGLGMLLATASGAWPNFVRAWSTAEFAGVEGIFTIAVWPIKLIIVVGCAMSAVVLALQVVTALKGAFTTVEPRRWHAAAAVLIAAVAVALLARGDVEPRTVGVAMIVLVVAGSEERRVGKEC